MNDFTYSPYWDPETGAPSIIRSDGKRSDPVGYQGIARLDEYAAVTPYYHSLPPFFKIEVL